MSAPTPIDRPPRIQPELPIDEVEIPKPPATQDDGQSRLAQIGLPLITIVGYVFVSLLGGGGRNPWLLVPMALSVVASSAFSIYSYRREQQRRAEADQAYADRLIELGKELYQAHDLQRRFYDYNYPDPQASLSIARESQAQSVSGGPPTLRAVTRLWERRVADEDFGMVRLGIGTLPSTVIYTLSGVEEFSSPQARAARKLADDSRFVTEVPVTVTLRQPPEAETGESEDEQKPEEQPRTPFAPALAVAGQSEAVYEFARALLGHSVVFHAPTDVRLFICADRKAPWAWAERLPHCRAGELGPNLLWLDAIKPAAVDDDEEEGNERDRFFEGLRKLLTQRKIRLQEREESQDQGSPTQPFCLVVVDMLSDGKPSPLSAIEEEAAISILLEEGATLGAAVIFLVNERSKAPSGCHGVIEVEETAPNTNSKTAPGRRLHFRYAETGVNTFRYVGVADHANLALMEQLAETLSSLDIRQGPGANLPATVPFLALEGFQSLVDLRSAAHQRWSTSEQEDQKANWLRVKLGLMAGNKVRQLVFSAKRDGVHGMVAGSTGSGKSELLISLISGMAVSYSPSTLNFVLVDYKGGGAFSEFAQLPHCVDILTNFAADGVTRMFTAITAEMQRRQRLNVETRTKNIVEYRRKGYHRTVAPYPFLFIIIDEFAEMIADRAEYKTQLESITRVGRAQGVSLILAAQRPSGVTDQMRSNIKFRICMRVETPGESREMLRRPDAAYLPPGVPGRGFLQVGNENVELTQVAYSGDRNYAATGRAKVIWPERGGGYDPTQDLDPPELYKAIVATLADLAHKDAVPLQRAPWPRALPMTLALAQRLTAVDPRAEAITADVYLDDESRTRIRMGQPAEPSLTLSPAINRWLEGVCGWAEPLDVAYALRPVIGLVDNPYAARQLPLVVDFQRGHTVIFGASGWGKSTFLRTLVVSLAATHSLNHLHVYVLDLGGRSLSVLNGLPHVGALITPDDGSYTERVTQLIRRLNELIENRKALLSAAAVENIYEYNRANPASSQPGILVVVDNFLEFIESFNDPGDAPESVLDQFTALARQARPYGVHLAITIGRLEELPSQLVSLFTERFTLKLADPSEYRAILGGSVAEIGDVPGRGYTRIGIQPLAFQVALPLDLQRQNAEPANEIREVERLAQSISDYVQREQAAGRSFRTIARIDALPKAVLLRTLVAEQNPSGLPLDQGFLPALRQFTTDRWAVSQKPEHADWLSVPLGVAAGGRTRMLRLEAKADGVHAMVAGGTGAGKSELLMSLVVGLALTYDPSALNFVLVDYKGGGAFAPFNQLPHCVDSITNLNKPAVRRVFTAIRSELERRQALLREAGDIVKYRRQGLHQGPNGKPLPFLMIIIDEYAEMITDNPEFGEELDRITRLGRSLGVHLILASQRPTGVSDQMRANIKLRICLRVEGVDTSREMLRRADAAFLPNGMPGRGYLQIGNENIELIQVAYAGDQDSYGQLNERGEPARFYETAVQMARELLVGPPPAAPWPPFLPTALTFGEGGAPAAPGAPALAPPTPQPMVAEWLRGRRRWPRFTWGEGALSPVIGLLDDPAEAIQRPLSVELMRGHAIVFGASGWGKTTFLRSLAISLAATLSPENVHIHVLDLGGRSLEMLRDLPHVGTIISPDERGYEERVQQLLAELHELVDARKKLFSGMGVSTLIEYNNGAPPKVEPAIVLLIDNVAELIDTFGNDTRENPDGPLERFVALARQGRPYGIHFVITAARPATLNNKLYNLFTERFTLRLADPSEYSAVVGSNPGEIEEIPGRGLTRWAGRPLTFQVALMPGALDAQGRVRGEGQRIRDLGLQMAQVITDQKLQFTAPIRIQALPERVLYREILARTSGREFNDATVIDDLRAFARANWVQHATAEHADWLKVSPGYVAGETARTLTLSAKADGVHGLIAGGTGSGKSELLMTLIVGLALNYSPAQLNFVLVDFKGGGAFKPFEAMPHCVDVVTNLNKSAVHRMFTAIDAEIRRRQELNASIPGGSDIVAIRRMGKPIYPHLVIIIDEYAEMIDNNPEYRQQLDSITRVGRSLGINLILASQRPRGVSDQMRANIKLRLCLRVEEIETSREMLRSPDAALLPSIYGRGVLQVGNEGGELIQVAYSGANQLDAREPAVNWPDRPAAADDSSGETPKFFDVVVGLTQELARKTTVARPWHSFLPNQISLETPIADLKNRRRVVLGPAVSDWINGDTADLWPGVDWTQAPLLATMGLIDDPAQADQRPFSLDLGRNHVTVFGDSGSGKSSLLRTIAVDLATTHSPDELQIYGLDLSGRGFRSLEVLPHLGAAIYADEDHFDERLQRLFEILSARADERQRLISEAGCSSLYEYNARFPAQSQPAILVLIDGFEALRESYETLVDTALLPLVRRSLNVGIAFVVACNAPTSMGARLYSLFGERLTFSQTDPDRYVDIVGRGAVEIEALGGRGYTRVGGHPLLFQAALPAGVFPPTRAGAEAKTLRPEADDLQRIAATMDAHLLAHPSRLPAPDRINTLAEQIGLSELLQSVGDAPVGDAQVVLGINSSLAPVLIDLQQMGPHFTILGPPLSGKTTALRTWALALAQRYSPAQARMILIDLQGRLFDYGGTQRLYQLPHVLEVMREPEEIDALAGRIEQEAHALKAAGDERAQLFILIDNFEEFLDAVETQKQTKRLTQVARSFGRYGVHFVVAGGLELTPSDLRRGIMAPNFGIGLRTAPAVEALKVTRTPAALRGRELPVGRGFLVKAGQATMVQIGTPYPALGPSGSEEPTVAAQRIAAALDTWYHQTKSRWLGQKAHWTVGGKVPTRGDAPRQVSPLDQLRELLQAVARRELATVRAGDGQAIVVIERLLRPEVWSDREAILALAREVLVSLADPAIRESVELFCAACKEDELVDMLRDELQKLPPNGAAPTV